VYKNKLSQSKNKMAHQKAKNWWLATLVYHSFL
jgi:hypothetical protein